MNAPLCKLSELTGVEFDGNMTGRDRTYVECCRPGDRSVHRVMLTLKKQGRKLVFENEGTDPQAGAINATYSG